LRQAFYSLWHFRNPSVFLIGIAAWLPISSLSMSKSRHKKKAAKQIAPVQPNQCIAMIPKGKIVCGDMTAFTIETNKNCGKDLFRVGAAAAAFCYR
jgi:hypothetical protein